MTDTEFLQATNRLEKYFNKDYEKEQLREMYSALKSWNINKYAKAVTNCIRNCKYLPKIIDLLNAEPVERQAKQEIDFVKCDKCNNSGFIKYFVREKNGDGYINYEYLALCDCLNGINQRKVNGYKFPFASELNLIQR